MYPHDNGAYHICLNFHADFFAPIDRAKFENDLADQFSCGFNLLNYRAEQFFALPDQKWKKHSDRHKMNIVVKIFVFMV